MLTWRRTHAKTVEIVLRTKRNKRWKYRSSKGKKRGTRRGKSSQKTYMIHCHVMLRWIASIVLKSRPLKSPAVAYALADLCAQATATRALAPIAFLVARGLRRAPGIAMAVFSATIPHKPNVQIPSSVVVGIVMHRHAGAVGTHPAGAVGTHHAGAVGIHRRDHHITRRHKYSKTKGLLSAVVVGQRQKILASRCAMRIKRVSLSHIPQSGAGSVI